MNDKLKYRKIKEMRAAFEQFQSCCFSPCFIQSRRHPFYN